MTTKQKIQDQLKANGYNSRMVSVRENRGGLNESFTLTIRDASVNGATVKAIAESLEEVRRCPASGEILTGANIFIWVEYTDEVENQMAAAYLPAVEECLEEIGNIERHHGLSIVPTTFDLFRDNDWTVSLYDNGRRIGTFNNTDAKGISFAIAQASR